MGYKWGTFKSNWGAPACHGRAVACCANQRQLGMMVAVLTERDTYIYGVTIMWVLCGSLDAATRILADSCPSSVARTFTGHENAFVDFLFGADKPQEE